MIDGEEVFIKFKLNVHFLKTNSGKKGQGMPVVRNPQFYFREGFCWNNVLTTYIRCRMKQKTVQSTESMSFFSMLDSIPEYYMIAIMNSKFAAYYIYSFVNSTSHCTTGDAKLIPIVVPTESELVKCYEIFKNIITLKKTVNLNSKKNSIEMQELERKMDNFVSELYGI